MQENMEYDNSSIWGKKDKTEGHTRPLLYHMIDVASVVEAIWESVLHRDAQKHFTMALGLCDNISRTKQYISFWAGLHDIGKAFPEFQEQRRSLKKTPHGVVTAKSLIELLQARFGYSRELARHLATTVGGHHGVFPPSKEILDLSSNKTGDPNWAKIREDLAENLRRILSAPAEPPPAQEIEQPFFMALAGIVSVADWIASNSEFFPFGEETLTPELYRASAVRKAEAALKSLYWAGWAPPANISQMTEIFPVIKKYGANDLQRSVAHIAEVMQSPGLVIIEAPMGEGKTEAAMYLADCWAARLGQRGCYFALPTQATSNQMFSRIREFLACRYPESQINLMLLHGHASLSAEFGTLKENFKRLVAFEGIGTDEQSTSAGASGNVLAAEWFTHRKRGLLAPFGVGTIDQILLSVLQTKHVFVRLFGLSHKTVIVDEVHAYDAYMITLLERLLEWLGALRCSVVLLSATLPKERTAVLMASYAKGAKIESESWEVLLHEKPYPRVTWLSHDSRGARTVETSPRSAKNLHIEWTDGRLPVSEEEPFELGQRLREVLCEGGCAAIVCSTVGRAQNIYQALQPYFPCEDAGDGFPELDLLHARYLFKDREARERRALLRFGKPGGMVDYGEDGLKPVVRPHRAVLVSTQIIEQSLDLDFDIMVTDMAPIDLLIQRAGRIHRHMRENRPEKLEKPKLWVCRPENDDREAPAFDKGTETIYGGDWKYILLLSWLALRDLQEFKIPNDVEEAIEFVYGKRPQINSDFSNAGKEVQTAKEKLTNKIDEYAYMAMSNRILGPDDESLLEDFNRGLEEDNPEIHETLRALTRPNELPSLDCIFLFQKDGEHFFDPECSLPADKNLESGNFNPVHFLRNSVRLSHRALVPNLIEKGEKPSCWNKNPFLRHHRLLSLDARERTVDFAGYKVRLDPDLGVLIDKRKEEG